MSETTQVEGSMQAERVMMDIKLIDADPTNAREPTPEQVEQRADEMKAQGQLAPIKIRPAKKGRYVVVYGHLRLLAAKLLSWKEIWFVMDADLTPLAAKQQQIMENHASVPLTPFEEYKQLKSLAKVSGESSAARLAVLANMKPSTVKNRLEIGSLPEALGRRVGRNGFSQNHAKFVAPLKDHPEVLNAITTSMVDAVPEVDTLEAFARDMVAFIIGKGFAVNPMEDWYSYGIEHSQVRELVGKFEVVKLKALKNSWSLVMDVEKFKATAEKLRMKQEEEEAKEAEREADPEQVEEGESKAEKKQRLAREAERLADAERTRVLRVKAAKLLGKGLGEKAATLSHTQATWLATFMELSDRADEESGGTAVLVQALGLTPAQATKMMSVEWSDVFGPDGQVVVPAAWEKVLPEQQTAAMLAATVLSFMSYSDVGEHVLTSLTGLDRRGWLAEAEAPAKRKGKEATGESATNAEPAPDAEPEGQVHLQVA